MTSRYSDVRAACGAFLVPVQAIQPGPERGIPWSAISSALRYPIRSIVADGMLPSFSTSPTSLATISAYGNQGSATLARAATDVDHVPYAV